MPASHESTFTISVADLDKTLLPEHARVPTTDAFRQAVTDLIRSEYGNLGGRARIVIDDKAETIQVTWRPGAGQPDSLDVAVKKLEKGQVADAIKLLEILRFQHPQKATVLYNLGMALSDTGRLDLALQHLRSSLTLAPNDTNCLVAFGVALARIHRTTEAIPALRQALKQEPDHPWAHRNLGACLLQDGMAEEAERHLRRAVELRPTDQQALFGLGQALAALGREKEADEQYIKVIQQDERSPIAAQAKTERSNLAGVSFRQTSGGAERIDALMYLVGALQRFENMPHPEIKKITFEIAILGQAGLDTNDSDPKYTLRSLPGQYSGLHLVSIMFVGFKIVAPEHDVGFDLSREYEAALALHRQKQSGQ